MRPGMAKGVDKAVGGWNRRTATGLLTSDDADGASGRGREYTTRHFLHEGMASVRVLGQVNVEEQGTNERRERRGNMRTIRAVVEGFR